MSNQRGIGYQQDGAFYCTETQHCPFYQKALLENKTLKEELGNLRSKIAWCKEVEEGNEYPELLNASLVRVYATIGHLRDGRADLALKGLLRFTEGLAENEIPTD